MIFRVSLLGVELFCVEFGAPQQVELVQFDENAIGGGSGHNFERAGEYYEECRSQFGFQAHGR